MIFYKIYQYSVKATACSVVFSLVSLLLAVLAIACFNLSNPVLTVLGVVFFAAAAVFCYIYLSRKLPDKIAEKEFNKKITTNAKFAYRFCKQNSGYFESVAAQNPEFAENYMLNDEGKVVKAE